MPQHEISKLKRVLLGLLAFFGPIAIGALAIKVGGYMAFWYLCYFLMLIIPVALILYLIYKFIFQIAAEKVEDRFEDEGKEFLSTLKENFDVLEEVTWDRSFYKRSRFSPRKPFDRLALSVSENWFTLPQKQKKQLMSEIYNNLREWIRNNGLEKNNHSIRLDFYRDINRASSLVGQYIDGQARFITITGE